MIKYKSYQTEEQTMIVEKIRKTGIIPVVVINDTDSAEPLADALVEGGLPCAEITLRTEAGLGAIERLAKRTNILVGAGTVLSIEQAEAACGSGASFIVSPGFSSKVVQWCLQREIAVFPGIATPSELQRAYEMGLTTVKFFPAEALGGMSTLKALASVYTGMKFMPTGGITTMNVKSYLAHRQVVACGGSWMVKPDWITRGRFDIIIEETRKAVGVLQIP
jgi:2-dehydro-3-deoxyphosphogluconate aldolase/(4S)-4-hydroxy-2-oxoglutarate aldolase